MLLTKSDGLYYKNLIKVILTLFFLYSTAFYGQSKFTKKQVTSDLEYLKKSLIESQYNIYESISKESFEKGYQKLKEKITNDSLNLLEATSLLQQLPALINNGHTSIDFPISAYMNYASSDSATLFPLEIAFEGDKALIRKNWSKSPDVKTGDEIISINGLTINEVLLKIYPHISAERSLMKNVKIELYAFPRYYWQIFGQVNKFDVAIKQNGKIKTFKLDAIKLIEDFEMKRTEVLNASMTLKFYNNTAYLNPGNFGGDLEKFKSFIIKSFAKIKEEKSKNLIIDLRNNSGGDNDYSDYMVSFIANRPFTWNSSFSLRTSKLLKDVGRKKENNKSKYWQSIFKHKDGTRYPYVFDKIEPQPKEKRFIGKVYILVNRQSHSQAAVTAAQIQDYNFGTIVGEETGEFPSLIASVFYFDLPNTGIKVQMSKGKIIRVNGSTKPEGVIPDIFIKDYLLDQNDEILKGLLKYINH